MKAGVCFLLCLMLSACWLGPDFYEGTASVQPIPPGTYKVVRIVSNFERIEDQFSSERGLESEIDRKIRISYAINGNVIVEGSPDGGGDSNVRLIPLDEANGHYIVQVDPGAGVAAIDKNVYGFVKRTADGFQLSAQLCDDKRRIKPNSNIIVGGLFFKRRVCSYKDRATFEAAMRKYAADPVNYTEYRLVKSSG